MKTRRLLQPLEGQAGELLKTALRTLGGPKSLFVVVSAWAKLTGLSRIWGEIQRFRQAGGRVIAIVGIDQRGTSLEALQRLCEVADERYVFHDSSSRSFHPKFYLVASDTAALLISGSGNLTLGGLFTNFESFDVFDLDLGIQEDLGVVDRVRQEIDDLLSDSATARPIDAHLLDELTAASLVLPEAAAPRTRASGSPATGSAGPFGSRAGLPGAPPPQIALPSQVPVEVEQVGTPAEIRGFVMTLHQTDVGTGQLTAGAARRSPELFVPLRARNAHPEIWGWPNKFTEDPDRPGKFDRFGVPMRIGASVVLVNMMTWPVKHDFRLRNEVLRSAGSVGDILRIEMAPEGSQGFEYYVEVIPMGTSEHVKYLGLCANPTPNSQRRWGYY